MINVSNEFWKLMHEKTDFKQNAVITFQDGTVLEVDESLFTMSNNSVTDAAGVNSVPLGVALSRGIQIELQNDDKRFSTYDFFGARIRLILKFELSDSVEKIEYGTFTVVSPATYGETVIITANDDMYKANASYSTNIVFPAPAWMVLQDSCASCGIPLSTTQFLNKDFEIQEKPSADLTHLQVIGYIAMIACGNARINRQGYLEILSYDFSFLNEIADGGTFNPWTGGCVADGGNFEDWTSGAMLDGGNFADKPNYHILYRFKDSPRVDTDDVIITGVQTVMQPKEGETESKTILLGQNGYVLNIENPLISGMEEEALQRIGATMIGGRMRKFEGDHIAYPIAEFMDKAFVVDREGNTYGTILTDINFTFLGFTTFKNSAENSVRNASSFGSQGTQAVIQARKMVNAEKTARELAQENMTKALVESSGLYFTKEKQEDGSEICYGHNKPTLEESDTIWKFTVGAVGVSTDGGETYAYGFTVTGELLANVLTVYGVNADWIKVGTMLADRIQGGTLTLGGENNGVCSVLDEDGNQLCKIDIDGLIAIRGELGPWVFTTDNFRTNDYKMQFSKQSDGTWFWSNIDGRLMIGTASIQKDATIWGDLTVHGTKNRVVNTESYGYRKLNAYETAEAYFGDIGFGTIADNGKCVIEIEKIFAETVDLKEYAVFLQAESDGRLYVTEKNQNSFIIVGEPGAKFAYEIKAKQKGYLNERLSKAKVSKHLNKQAHEQEE